MGEHWTSLDVFVAGATGAVGRQAVAALIEAGHRVRGTARDPGKSRQLRELGAEPVEVDLFDAGAVLRAVAGADAVVRLTTRIPPVARLRWRTAWAETNRLRTEGARILVDAALGAGVQVYVHESVAFVYQDAGARWIDEEAPTDTADWPPLQATLLGEAEAARFAGRGEGGWSSGSLAYTGPKHQRHSNWSPWSPGVCSR
jgi:nucleoside-diphosphate-sugar epimerase